MKRGSDWIIHQVSRNSQFPGLTSLGIEGNISAYFGLLASGRKAEAASLGSAVYQPQQTNLNPTFYSGWDTLLRRLRPGAGSVYSTALDVSGSWGVTLLRSIGKTPDALVSQGYTASIMATSSFNGSILGYGDIAGAFTVAIEFTAQAAVAGIKDADSVMKQIYPLQISSGPYSGAFPGCTDHWYGGTLNPWCTTMPGVSPTAWVYFASSYIDPLWESYQSTINEIGVVPYRVTNRGTVTRASTGVEPAIRVAYGRLQPDLPDTTPSGTAIIAFRPGGTLVSETTVPASELVTSGRIYAEMSATVGTGLAIANPNGQAITLSFTYRDSSGVAAGSGSVVIPANNQIAAFLNQAPFNAPSFFTGTLTFTSTQAIGVIAIRGFTNERNEFLMTTLPVVPLAVLQGELLIPHFAAGDGWSTQIVLVNPTDQALSGTIQFFDPAGAPVVVTLDGQSGPSFGYSVAGGAALRFRVTGGSPVRVGSVRVLPATNSTRPAGVLIFSYDTGGVRVTEAGVPLANTGSTFRIYAETGGEQPTQKGSLRMGLAIANSSRSTPVTVSLQLFDRFGTLAGSTSFSIATGGQRTFFLDELPELALPAGFQGMLVVSETSSGVSVVGLRGRYNERADFLITTLIPVDEATTTTTAERSFPHLVDGAGYSTSVVLMSGPSGQAGSGVVRFFTQTGDAVEFTNAAR